MSFYASVTFHPVNWIGHIPSTTYSLSSPAKTGHSEFTGCGMILIIGLPMGTEYLMAPALFDLRPSRSWGKPQLLKVLCLLLLVCTHLRHMPDIFIVKYGEVEEYFLFLSPFFPFIYTQSLLCSSIIHFLLLFCLPSFPFSFLHLNKKNIAIIGNIYSINKKYAWLTWPKVLVCPTECLPVLLYSNFIVLIHKSVGSHF